MLQVGVAFEAGGVEKSTFSKCSVTDSESVGEINDSVAQQ